MRAPASFARSPITTSSQRSGTRSWNARVGANRRHVSAGSSVTFFVPSVTAAFDRSRGMASAEPPSNERCSNVLPRKTNTTVGIAIPAYKRGHHLAATLESALRQTRPADEIVIVDDCSPDNTRDVALAYASRGVRYVRNAVDFGVPENYNVSIDQLTSDYVFILEDHDLLAPTFVDRRAPQCAPRKSIQSTGCDSKRRVRQGSGDDGRCDIRSDGDDPPDSARRA